MLFSTNYGVSLTITENIAFFQELSRIIFLPHIEVHSGLEANPSRTRARE
jgi:hypothetical protein